MFGKMKEIVAIDNAGQIRMLGVPSGSFTGALGKTERDEGVVQVSIKGDLAVVTELWKVIAAAFDARNNRALPADTAKIAPSEEG